MKNTLITFLKAAVTILLLYFLFRQVDLHDFVATLKNARIKVLIGAFMLLWVGHYICIFRWRMLMRPLMPVMSLTQLFGIYCIGLFFNLTFPTVVGGDVVKMYYAGRSSKQYAQSFAATFLDRDAGMFAMMLIACCATLIKPMNVPGMPVRSIVWTATLGFVIANIAIFKPSWHRILCRLLHSWNMSKTATRIDTISSAFQVMGRHRLILAASLGISIINQLLVISVSWVLSLALRLEIPLPFFLVFIPVITLISMIPVSLNGMGLREYAFMSLFGAIGVDREACVALGLCSSAMIILSSLPGGIAYIFLRDRGDRQQISALGAELS
jgi:uncharacterized protein (TIRG00374 family)